MGLSREQRDGLLKQLVNKAILKTEGATHQVHYSLSLKELQD